MVWRLVASPVIPQHDGAVCQLALLQIVLKLLQIRISRCSYLLPSTMLSVLVCAVYALATQYAA